MSEVPLWMFEWKGLREMLTHRGPLQEWGGQIFARGGDVNLQREGVQI